MIMILCGMAKEKCALRESKNEMSHYMTKIVADVTQLMISAGMP